MCRFFIIFANKNYIYMRRIYCTILLICLISGFAKAQDIKIGIANFRAVVGLTKEDIDGVSAIFTTYFLDPSNYTLVERNQLDRLMQEQFLQFDGITDDEMVNLGRIMNLTYIVLGDITYVMGEYNIDVRLINVEKGDIIAASGGSWASGMSYRNIMQRIAKELKAQIIPSKGPTTSTSTQKTKHGKINIQEIVLAMPEFKDMQNKLEAVTKDWGEQLETIQVEFNNQYTNFQKDRANLSAAAVQEKESELQALQTRYVELQQVAQQDVERQQAELFRPIHQKAMDAVNKIAAAGGYTGIFDMSVASMAYLNESTVTDISAAVRKELGITE